MIVHHKMTKFILALLLLAALVYADNKVDSTLASTVDGQALFVRNETPDSVNNIRPVRQGAANMDQTVQNILQWLQGKYTQSNRIARQQLPSREYLPSLPGPSTTQKPRPFQTSAQTFIPQQPSISSGNVDINVKGYPYQQSPTPGFNLPSRPVPTSQTSLTSVNQESSFQSSVQSTYQPSTTYLPPPYSSTGQESYGHKESTANQGYDYNQPTNQGFNFKESTANQGSTVNQGTYYKESTANQGTYGSSIKETTGNQASYEYNKSTANQGFVNKESTISFQPSGPTDTSGSREDSYSQSPTPTAPVITQSSSVSTLDENEIDGDATHPPHIHAMNVQCSKDRMTIDIEFNRQFDGVIYSKGFYGSQQCRYVAPNSQQTKYSFTVMLNSCGTQFIDGFSEGKQAYLENVLVLQNEPGIQEVWDSIRSVRCLWEGNLNKALSVALSVDMLNQEVVTFSGDTATAKLDIQVGRGPFASLANGLVKIGETMTLVITVEGDPAFNVLVRECIARDNDPNSGNIVKLTDEQGCVLKPKLIGAFQTTRNPETNSLIAYAFFQAFKFPDVMDLTIECNVELCKTNCQTCPNPNQKLEPGKRRRRDTSNSSSIADPVTLGRRFRVFLPEDIEQSSPSNSPVVINVGSMSEQSRLISDSVCLSSGVFIATFTILLGTMFVSCLTTLGLWFRLHRNAAVKK